MAYDLRQKRRMAKILVVDDDITTLKYVALFLRSEGYHVVEAQDGNEASERLAKGGLDLIVSDVIFGLDGLRLLKRARSLTPEVPVVLMSGFPNIDPDQAIKLGAADFIEKPFLLQDLLYKVERALEKKTPPYSSN